MEGMYVCSKISKCVYFALDMIDYSYLLNKNYLRLK